MGQGSQHRPWWAKGNFLSACRRWGMIFWGFITVIWVTVFVVVMTLFMAIVERTKAPPCRATRSEHFE